MIVLLACVTGLPVTHTAEAGVRYMAAETPTAN